MEDAVFKRKRNELERVGIQTYIKLFSKEKIFSSSVGGRHFNSDKQVGTVFPEK